MAKKADKDPYKYESHKFYASSTCGKHVCWQCGLIALRNKATEWCIEKGCNYADHDSYKSTMTRLTKTFDF